MKAIFKGVDNTDVVGQVVLTVPQLKKLANKLMQVSEFAYDTETDSLDVQAKGRMNLVGISICFGENDTYYIPTGHYFDKQLPQDVVVKYLKPCFERLDVRIIGHNLKFDLHVLANVDINIQTKDIFDTMIARWITDENREKGLKGMTNEIYGTQQEKFDACIGTVTAEQKKAYGLKASNKAPFLLVSIKNGAPYALADSYWTWRHYVDWQMDELKDEKMETIFYKAQMPFLRTLYNMERRGIRIDADRLRQMAEKAEKDLEKLHYDMVEIAGVKFSPTSGQQLAELLFGYQKYNKAGEFSGNKEILDVSFNFPVISETATGIPQTGDAQLKALSKKVYKRDKRKQEGLELVKLLRRYKKLAKLKTAFIDGLIKQQYEDGKVHPSFNQVGCLTSETLIPTSKGIFPIGELADLGGDGEFIEKELNIVNRYRELEPTKYVVKYVNRETVKLTTTLGLTIEGTNNHPLIVNKYSQKEVTNNIKGCRLSNKYKESEEWRKLEDIKLGDYIAVPYGYNTFNNEYLNLDMQLPKIQTNAKSIKLPTLLTEELGEFLGIYYADGSIHDTNGTYSIRITNSSKDVIDRVTYLAKNLFDLEASVKFEPKKNSSTIYLTSKALSQLESTLELRRGCVNKFIPNCILQSPRSVVISFLRGLTLDSCVIKENTKTYLKYTVSNNLSARYIQELLLNIGIISSIRQDTNKTNNVFHVYIYNGEYIKFRDTIGFIESSKYLDVSLNSNSSPNYRLDEERKTLWVSVKKITNGYNDVYDFNVPNTHSFVSGAFISHNTDSGRLSCSNPK